MGALLGYLAGIVRALLAVPASVLPRRRWNEFEALPVERAAAAAGLLTTVAGLYTGGRGLLAYLNRAAGTKEELAQAIAPLATREELAQAIAPLATREELRQGLSGLRDELRGHMDVWAERIHDEVKLAFEAIQGVDEKHTRNFGELRQQIVQLSRTEAQHHAATMKNFEDLREVWRDYVKAHAKDHAESRKSFEKLTGRVEKLESKGTRKRKIS